MKNSVGFIGGGRITKIMLQGFRNSNVQFDRIVITDKNPEVQQKLKMLFPEVELAEVNVTAARGIVFIALHPPVIMETIELIKNQVRPDAVVISLAPKISIQKIKTGLQHAGNIARLIPNATSYINKGFNPIAFTSDFDHSQKELILNLLSKLGNTFEVTEEKLESYAIMSAMLPTYFWFQWQELENLGNQFGLSAEESRNSIYETILASLDLMFKSGLSYEEVIDLIPVKPIGDHEQQITEIYRTKLEGLYDRIKP